MGQLNLASATFMVGSLAEVAREISDPSTWAEWASGLELTVDEDRGTSGVRWRVAGAVTGTAEVWLEPVMDGVVVHWFLRGEGRSAASSREVRYRGAWSRYVFALKDRLEEGRAPGVKPGAEAAED